LFNDKHELNAETDPDAKNDLSALDIAMDEPSVKQLPKGKYRAPLTDKSYHFSNLSTQLFPIRITDLFNKAQIVAVLNSQFKPD